MGCCDSWNLVGGQAANPCAECPPSTPDNESLPSALENIIYHFFGNLTKTQDETGKIIWTLPCDLTTGIEGNPRVAGEGLACYFKRLLEAGVIGLNGANGFASTTASFVQPAIGATVVAHVDSIASFGVNQYVWSSAGGFYQVTAIGDLQVTLKNLLGPPNNLSAGATVDSGSKLLPSGPAALPGTPGETGPAGEMPTRAWEFSFSTNPKWVCPVGVTQVRVRLYGAGGGGGSAHGGLRGYAGGGGEYAQAVIPVVAGTIYTLRIGYGGSGDATGYGGAAGQSTQFSDPTSLLLEAAGGGGGTAGDAGSPHVGTGGTGGGGSATAELRLAGDAGGKGWTITDRDNGGACGRLGTGGTPCNAGALPGGGGGGGHTSPQNGANGGHGMASIEVIP